MVIIIKIATKIISKTLHIHISHIYIFWYQLIHDIQEFKHKFYLVNCEVF